MTWATIRDGMKTRLDTISGLVSSDVYVESAQHGTFAMVVPGEPLVAPAGHNGYVAVNVVVRVQCVRATLKDSQDALDAYVWPTGASSIVAAVHGDRTLSGAVDDIKFSDVRNYGRVEGSQGAAADVAFQAQVRA